MIKVYTRTTRNMLNLRTNVLNIYQKNFIQHILAKVYESFHYVERNRREGNQVN